MKKINYLLCSVFVTFLFFGCSSSDDSDPDTPLIFNGFTVNKTHSFIEDVITLNVDGEGFTEVIVTSDNPDISIRAINTTTYEISATSTGVGIITVELKNDSATESEIKVINFYEHGVIDFKIVEGIETGVDKLSKVLDLLGEPEARNTLAPQVVTLTYSTKGVFFIIENDLVIRTIIFANPWTVDGSPTGFAYPYSINKTWNFSDAQLTMDHVVSALGDPDSKTDSSSGNSSKRYTYNQGVQGTEFHFSSDALNNYQGKFVSRIVFFKL